MSSTIELSAVETSILAALADLHVSAGGPIRTLRGFAGPWSAARRVTALALPAIFVRYAGRKAPTAGSGQLGGWSRWTVTVAVGGGRGEVARRAGPSLPLSTDSPAGAWPLLDAVRERLRGRIAVAGCGPLVPLGEAAAESDTGWAVWEQTWEFSLPMKGGSRPLMALAADGPYYLSPRIDADQTEVDVDQGAQVFTVGEPLFLATLAGAENVYLGHVIAIEEGRVRFEFPPPRDFPGNSMLWSPSTWFEWSTGRFPGTGDTWDRGTESIRAGDGAAMAVRLRAARRSTAFGAGPVAAGELALFREWLDTHTRGGVDPFTWVDERRAVCAAVVQSASWSEQEDDDGFSRVKFDMALDEPGSRV